MFIGDGNSLPITYTGKAVIPTGSSNLILNDVLLVSRLKKNLLSISKLTSENKYSMEFTSLGFFIKNQKQQIIAKGSRRGGLYALDNGHHEVLSAIQKGKASSKLWHMWLGHPNSRSLQVLNKN